MVIIATLIVLFIIFFFLRKNIGASLLATIAGLSVYEMFGNDLINFLAKSIDGADLNLIKTCVYLVFVFGLPMILYLRSSRGGLFGILRIAEAGLFAALLASLCSSQIAYFFPFDQTATDIITFIDSVKGWILVVGVGVAYLDILVCREV